MANGNGLWTQQRPVFLERLASLAGGTTYREPVGGHGTKTEHQPNAHAYGMALAYAKRGPEDIGPDVAYCIAVRCDAYRNRVVSRLSQALRCHELRHANGYRTLGANAAWDIIVWDRDTAKPNGVSDRTWHLVLSAACSVMENSAWDALARAERAYRRIA